MLQPLKSSPRVNINQYYAEMQVHASLLPGPTSRIRDGKSTLSTYYRELQAGSIKSIALPIGLGA